MIPVIGRALILASLLFATAGAITALQASRRGSAALFERTRLLTTGYVVSMIAVNLLMVYALLARDFSVGYVAQVGAIDQPDWVAVVSLWSSLEGSILFWGLVLSIFIGAAIRLLDHLDRATLSTAVSVWLFAAAFFSLLIAQPAQPFGTVLNPSLDGPGPNPLLQNHILMAVHPPMLYLGYVGMTIPFGLAAAALVRGSLPANLLKSLRTSLLLPWTFLSVAIVLGGWWAYEVLGWGGYWAWDPVENASFLPWLTATAALHSLIVVQRRRALISWSLTLVLATFLLTILGTFMTRSGVFNSVHSFTQSSIGPIILAFLSAALIFSVILLAGRVDAVSRSGSGEPVPLPTREGMFLGNNLLFVLLTFTVLIGTVFPLIVEAMSGRQMSVGRPYFDRMAVPVGIALLFLMGIGPALPWGESDRKERFRKLTTPLIGATIALLAALAFGLRNLAALMTVFAAGYTLQVTLTQLARPVRGRIRSRDENLIEATSAAHLRRGRRRFGSYVVHASAIVIFVAIAVSSSMGTRAEKMLNPGEVLQIGDYALELVRVDVIREPHRLATIARIRVHEEGSSLGIMSPRMNQYENQREPIGTPDVYTRAGHDLYLTAMSIDPGSQRVGLAALINPMVGWIWGATGLMALGALIALIPRRRLSASPIEAEGEPAS